MTIHITYIFSIMLGENSIERFGICNTEAYEKN